MESVPLQVQDDPTGDWQKASERNKVKAKIFIEEDIYLFLLLFRFVFESIDNECIKFYIYSVLRTPAEEDFVVSQYLSVNNRADQEQ